MAAGKLDIVLEQGGTFEMSLQVLDDNNAVFDLTGYTAIMKIVDKITNTIVDVSTVGSVSVSDKVYIKIPDEYTATLESDSNEYAPSIRTKYANRAYEIAITKDGDIKKIARGNAYVVRRIV
ncbi:hypothetical protein [Sulfuricurvum sp.]|uniref:hypothetical protein n=1 Tax=Sulfuricurvum sp. TaxID=2025608 RepID=UPI0026170AFD|nr:hypothetical protein [Sulfuricurvum sp.]MDD2267458.1 hypothetical protein [Sulfuricurvum sp.]MDD2782820.1 hypothetical protein [Sulfuricurvum sp.]